nr:nicotinamidase-like [Onthophagus taurus]
MALNHIITCFNSFDKDQDGGINLEEFRLICQGLFRNDRGIFYTVAPEKLKIMLGIFDKNLTGALEFEEFMFCWYNWFKYIIHPRSVCIVVNMQNDYLNGVMALAATGFAEAAAAAAAANPGQGETEEVVKQDQKPVNIIDTINQIIGCDFEHIYYVMDHHPSNHISFIDNLSLRPLHPASKVSEEDAKLYDTVVFALPAPYTQKLWPKHCVENSWGSELDMDLRISSKGTRIYTGTNAELDQHSAFRDSTMPVDGSFHQELSGRNITDVYVVGASLDMCVRATCLDSLSLGYRTVMVEDCCKVMNPLAVEKAKQDVINKNGVIAQSADVKNMTEGKDRRPEMGYVLAIRLRDYFKNRETKTEPA